MCEKKGIWLLCAICDCNVANRIDRDLTIGRWNEHNKKTRHVTDLTKHNIVDDTNKSEKSGEKLNKKGKKISVLEKRATPFH